MTQKTARLLLGLISETVQISDQTRPEPSTSLERVLSSLVCFNPDFSISDAKCDPTLGQVVGRDFQLNPIARNDFDIVFAHLPTDVCDHLAANVELDTESGICQSLFDSALDLDRFFFSLLHV